MKKKAYTRPRIKSETIQIGVFGKYGNVISKKPKLINNKHCN